MKLKKGNGDKKESKLFPKEAKFGTSLKDLRAGLIKSGKTPQRNRVRFKEGSREHKRIVAIMNMKPTYTFEGKTYNSLSTPNFPSTFNPEKSKKGYNQVRDFYHKTPVKDAETLDWGQLYDRDFKDDMKFEKKVKSDKMKEMGEFFKKESARARTKDLSLIHISEPTRPY